MKYKCDMVQDLMPLCVDGSATETSKAVVVEHLAECKTCVAYYEELNKELSVESEEEQPSSKYVALAKRIRKRKYISRSIIALIIIVVYAGIMNFALGYRMKAQSAADLSGRLNTKSVVIGSYPWKGRIFYFYDSDSCYDVVGVRKTWHGWVKQDNCLNWPKIYKENDDYGELEGIQMVGTLYFWEYDEGIQLVPMMVLDEEVKKLEVSCFGRTKTVEPSTEELTFVTFENSDTSLSNEIQGNAYDAKGELLYTLESKYGYRMWIPVAE